MQATRPCTQTARAKKVGCAYRVYLDDVCVPIDNHTVENSIRPLTLGRKNGLFVGSAQGGERADTLMILMESAELNEHDARSLSQGHSG